MAAAWPRAGYFLLLLAHWLDFLECRIFFHCMLISSMVKGQYLVVYSLPFQPRLLFYACSCFLDYLYRYPCPAADSVLEWIDWMALLFFSPAGKTSAPFFLSCFIMFLILSVILSDHDCYKHKKDVIGSTRLSIATHLKSTIQRCAVSNVWFRVCS